MTQDTAAEECATVALDKEFEATRENNEDILFFRIGDPIPLLSSEDSSYDLDRPPNSPLCVSDSHHALFVAHSRGFLVAKTRDVVGAAKKKKEKGQREGGCSIKDVSLIDVEIGRVSILALSEDCSMLAAAVWGDVKFYEVLSLLKKDQEPCSSCSIEKSEITKDFKWRRSMEKSFLILSSHGNLKQGRSLHSDLLDVMDSVDAVDWSVKGDAIAVSRKSTISILSPDFKERKRLSLLFQTWYADADPESFIRVDSIKWIHDDSIVVGCVRVVEDNKEEDYLIQVITCKENALFEASSKPVVFSFPNLFGVINDILPIGCGPYLLLSYLERWKIAPTSIKKAGDEHIQLLRWSSDGDEMELVSLENEHEKYAPRILVRENGDDNLILGFSIDKISFENVKVELGVETKELLPYCVLLCLTADGKLYLFYAARFSDPCDQSPPSFQSSDDSYSGPIGLTLENPVANEPCAVSSPKDVGSPGGKASEGVKSNISVKNIDTLRLHEPQIQSFTSALNSGGNGNLDFNVPSAERSSNVTSLDGKTGPAEFSTSSAERISSVTSLDGKIGIAEFSVSSAGRSSSAASLDGASGVAFASLEKSRPSSRKDSEVVSNFTGLTSSAGASVGSQPPGRLFSADVPSRNSFLSPSKVVPGEIVGPSGFGSGSTLPSSSEKFTDSLQSSGKPLLSKTSTAPPSVFPFSSTSAFSLSSNKGSSNEGFFSSRMENKHANSASATRGLPVSSRGDFTTKTSVQPKMQQLFDNTRGSISSQTLNSEPELSQQFYDVRSMTNDLDSLLSSIEQEGGHRDACTIFHQDSLLAFEKGLKNFSEKLRAWKHKMVEQLKQIEQLRDNMSKVSARQVYMEGIVKQVSDNQYWDLWNLQKLSPEFESKQQRILEMNLNLTNQLIELERHFNSLEISKFGESDAIHVGQNFRRSIQHSRSIKSLQSIYCTLNSQLAAAEQLSECLSKQISALNINSPLVRRGNVAKELLESIGLTHEAETFQSPNTRSPFVTPSSTKRIAASNLFGFPRENSHESTSCASKIIEPETASRRRRDSLDRNLTNFGPQKTTVKRIPPEHFRDSKDKSFRKGTQEPSPETFEVQSNSLFKWSKGTPGSYQTLQSQSYPLHEMLPVSNQLPLLRSTSQSLYSAGQNNKRTNSPILTTKGTMHMAYSDSSTSKPFASSTSSNLQPQPFTSIAGSLNFDGNATSKMTKPFPESSQMKGEEGATDNLKNGASSLTWPLPGSFNDFAVSGNASSVSKPTSGLSDPLLLSSKRQPSNNVSSVKPHLISSLSSSSPPGTSTVLTTSVSSTASLPFSCTSFPNPFEASLHSAKPVGEASLSSSVASVASLAGSLKDFPGTANASNNQLPGFPRPSLFSSKAQSICDASTVNSHTVSSLSGPTLSTPSSAMMASSSVSSMASLPFSSTSFATPLGASSQSAKPRDTSIASQSSSSPGVSAPSSFLPFHKQASPAFPHSSASENSSLQTSPLRPNTINSDSVSVPPQASSSESSVEQRNIGSKSVEATLPAAVSDVSLESASQKTPVMVPFLSETGNVFAAASGSSGIPSVSAPALSSLNVPKDNQSEISLTQEDEMEEEAPDTTSTFNLGSFGGFGLGSTPTSNAPKPNPFVGSFSTSSNTSPSLSFTSSPGEVFRPASFSLPSAQPIQQPLPERSEPFSGGASGGLSSFGQPAQIGTGQQALGSFLGAFGQSRQLGTGAPGLGFASPGVSGAGGFSAAASTGGGFAAFGSNSGGFSSAATGGGFAAFGSNSGGFSSAATGGGFAALASSSGGFAAAVSAGGGFAAAPPGSGFAAAAIGPKAGSFGTFSGSQGGSFSSFGGSSSVGAGKPPAELFTQIRK